MNGKYFVWIFLSCCTSNVSFAEDNVQQVCHQLEKLASTFRDAPDGPLCGVYATYRALKVLRL